MGTGTRTDVQTLETIRLARHYRRVGLDHMLDTVS